MVEIVGEVDLVEADGGDVVEPVLEERFVFGSAKVGVEGGAGGEEEVVDDAVFVIAEIEAGGGGL